VVSPQTSILLKKRFQYAADLAKGEKIQQGKPGRSALGRDIVVNLPRVADFLNCCANSFFRRKSLTTLFEAVSNGNVRNLLEYVTAPPAACAASATEGMDSLFRNTVECKRGCSIRFDGVFAFRNAGHAEVEVGIAKCQILGKFVSDHGVPSAVIRAGCFINRESNREFRSVCDSEMSSGVHVGKDDHFSLFDRFCPASSRDDSDRQENYGRKQTMMTTHEVDFLINGGEPAGRDPSSHSVSGGVNRLQTDA
jgi:hypothetical protein